MTDTPRTIEDPALIERRVRAHARLFSRINYERCRDIPYSTRGLKLERMRELLARLGSPECGLAIVHVAGTKGKGSVSAMIGAMLTAAGHRVGVFSSPHLERLEERLMIDARPCPSHRLVELIEQVWPAVETMDVLAGGEAAGPTFFEITTALAFLYFAQEQVDAVVLEVGLGGRLDSTNVCLPVVSVITSISFDHTRQLGGTLARIAWEKAGIIKPGVPVVSGVTHDEPRRVIRQVAADRGCRLIELRRDFQFQYQPARYLHRSVQRGRIDFRYDAAPAEPSYRDLELGLLGRHQAENAATALAALVQLQRAGWRVGEDAIRRGLGSVVLPARVEVVQHLPLVLIDAAHNVASVRALLDVLNESFSARPRRLVFGTSEDKDARGMLVELAPHFEQIVLTRYQNNPRSMCPWELKLMLAAERTAKSQVFEQPGQAWDHVCASAAADDLIAVTGSFFLSAELRRRVLGDRSLAASSAIASETTNP